MPGHAVLIALLLSLLEWILADYLETLSVKRVIRLLT
jgi:hypothetical protein